jgi:hypothetical protein
MTAPWEREDDDCRSAKALAERRRAMGKPKFFKTPADFRAWLVKNHQKADELLVGFYKKSSGSRASRGPSRSTSPVRRVD